MLKMHQARHRSFKLIIRPPKTKNPRQKNTSAKDEYIHIRGATQLRNKCALLRYFIPPTINARHTSQNTQLYLSLRPPRSICRTVLTSLTAPEALCVVFFRRYLRFNGLITLYHAILTLSMPFDYFYKHRKIIFHHSKTLFICLIGAKRCFDFYNAIALTSNKKRFFALICH